MVRHSLEIWLLTMLHLHIWIHKLRWHLIRHHVKGWAVLHLRLWQSEVGHRWLLPKMLLINTQVRLLWLTVLLVKLIVLIIVIIRHICYLKTQIN